MHISTAIIKDNTNLFIYIRYVPLQESLLSDEGSYSHEVSLFKIESVNRSANRIKGCLQ